MFTFLRIFFTILSAICIAAVIPVGSHANLTWAIVCALGAFMFYLLMLVCKQAQIASEAKKKETEEVAETPKSDNENPDENA